MNIYLSVCLSIYLSIISIYIETNVHLSNYSRVHKNSTCRFFEGFKSKGAREHLILR